MSAYVKAIGRVCGCFEDDYGNMPCDNGSYCTKCEQLAKELKKETARIEQEEQDEAIKAMELPTMFFID